VDFPILSSLPEGERLRVIASGRPRRFSRREVIVHEGQPSDSFHLVQSGRLAVRVATPDGLNAMLNVLSPGDYFGEISLVDMSVRHRRTATVVALEDSSTLSYSDADFRRLRDEHPQLERVLIAALAQRVDELSTMLLQALYEPLGERVVRRLATLASVYRGVAASGEAVTIPLTQESLAEFVGGTRPSVNQVLQRLQREGVLTIGRGRVVVDPRALHA